jgi:hypothetical protein
VEWSEPTLVFGRRISTALDEELREIKMAVEGCLIEWSPPTLILGCCVGALLYEELRNIEMTTA